MGVPGSARAWFERPADLRALSRSELRTLAGDMRERLIDVCSRTGGHIGAGLGVAIGVSLSPGRGSDETPDDGTTPPGA